jgi:signal transduction histidine kinase/ligand-binding sensor domain-containing protein/DNA-binding response OmpR family regulator
MNKKSIILCIFYAWMSILCYGQTGRLFTADQELSSSMINSIYQDHNGIIWIATEDGLNKYDGAKFSIYKSDKNDEHSLANNYVRCVFESSKKECFVGTLSGLQHYSADADRFTDIPLILQDGIIVEPNVAAIEELSNGDLLVGTAGQGLFKITNTHKGLVGISMEKRIPIPIVNALHEDRNGNLWISAGENGIFRIDRNQQLHCYQKGANESEYTISSICETPDKQIYIGSLGKGLLKYNPTLDLFEPIIYANHPELPVKSLLLATPDEIYIGTDGYGLKVYNIQSRTITENQLNITTFNLDKSKIHSIMKDRFGNLWLGFFQKGVLLIPAIANGFQYIGYKSVRNNIIGSNCIMSVCNDHDGTLWIGTDNDGLYKVEKNGKHTVHFPPTQETGSVPSTIMSIYEDSRQNLWIGSYMQSMAKIDKETGHCQYFKRKTDADSKEGKLRVYSFAEDKHDRLWIGTMGNGLYYIDLNTETLHRYEQEDSTYYAIGNFLPGYWITSLLHSHDERLYIGTYDGLGCLDLKTMHLATAFNTNTLLPNSVIHSLYEDKEGTIWIGTSEGLKAMHPQEYKIREYTQKDGLPGDIICAITQDINGALWFSTNHGIARYNPQKGNFTPYYANDGLQGNEFSKRAVCTDNNGHILFGGINGVTYFNPAEIKDIATTPSVHLTGFYIHNQSVNSNTLSEGRRIIETSVMNAQQFNLSHKHNSFSMEFSVMEFFNPERITYMYSVNNGQWVTMQSGINRISFNDMTPGTYKFSIKAKDYTFYSEPKNFIVNISPAWYASNWAKGVYLLIALTIIYIIGAQIRHRYQVHQKLLEHIHAEEINEAKLQFFINISHEIRTPVTLILSPLQKLMSKDRNEERQKNYQTISRNAGRLLQLVNQLLDIRKLDKGQMQLKFREVEIVEFIRNLSSSFEYQANAKKISLNFHPDTEELRAWIDPENLDKAIFNVLSNAFKFTESGGEINIYLQTHEAYETKPAYFKIVIEDSGTGIDEKEIERIFDRFYQVANRLNNSGTGIGLHLTKSLVELHKGTIHAENNKEKAGCRFIIRLPLGKEHLKPEEIEETNTEGQIASDNNPVLPIFLPENEEKERIRTKTKYRILIADDNEEIRRYIRQELTPDYHITECNNGQEAFEQIIKDAPDALISDVMMPEMDGMTLCRKIRQNILVSHIPVILLTAKINEESNLEALEGGVDAYITKPFNIDVLKKTIRNVIYRHELIKNTFNGSMEQTDKVQPIEVQSPDEKLIARVMAIINKEIANPNLSVEMIAAEAGISRVHLYRKIKEFTNQSPRNFIRNVRLKQAALLLAQKHHNITEVAEAVGFANTTHFSTAFKELFGVSPTIYMEQSANNAKSNIVDTMEKNKVE